MKMPIEWHEKNLANMRKHAGRMTIQLKILQEGIDELFSDCEFLEYQITEAKKANKDGFDRERFRVKIGLTKDIF